LDLRKQPSLYFINNFHGIWLLGKNKIDIFDDNQIRHLKVNGFISCISEDILHSFIILQEFNQNISCINFGKKPLVFKSYGFGRLLHQFLTIAKEKETVQFL